MRTPLCGRLQRLITGIRQLNVSTNQLPVADVVFSERSLQGMLLSKNLPVDDPSHERKKCEEPQQRQIHTRSLLSPYRERSTDSTALQG